MDKLWLIKDKKGRIFGPYNEKEVCFHIENGEFTGEELYSKYPTGQWQPLSTKPIFYEKVLATINKSSSVSSFSSSESSISESKSSEKEPIEATRIIAPKSSPKKGKVKIKLSKEFKKEIVVEDDDHIIEMENVNERFFDKLKESIKAPILILILIAGLFVYYSFNSNNTTINTGESIRLLAPSRSNTLTPKETIEKEKKAITLYFRSSVSNYLSAQNLFVQVLESQNKKSLPYMFLCLTHLELWPFSYQDTKDKQTLKKTLSLAQKLDTNKSYFDICKIVKTFIDKKFELVLMITERLSNPEETEQLNSPKKEFRSAFVFYLKAKALNSLKKQKEAYSILETITIIESKWIAPYMLQAEIKYQNKEYDLAFPIYKKILSIYKNHPSAQLRLGVLEYKFKNFKKSEKILKRVLDKFNDWVNPDILFDAYVALANIYIQKNEKQSAIKYSNFAYGLYPTHPEMNKLKSKLKDETNFENTKIKAKSLIYKGDFLVNQGDCFSAIEQYEKAYKAGNSALAAVKIAECYWQARASGQAIRWLKKAINSDNQLLEAYFLLSDYLSQLFNFESAIEYLNAVKKISPSNADLFKAYGLLAFRQKKYNNAIAWAERSLKIYTSDIEVYILMSQSYLKLEKGLKAFSFAKKAIEENINNSQAQIAYALTLDIANEDHNTEQYFKGLIKKFPSIIEYQQALGEYYFHKEEYQKAQKEFENIISSNPKFKPAYIYLGQIHSALSLNQNNREYHYKQALKYFIEATLLDISDPKPIFYVGKTYLNHKDYQIAETEFKKILAINPNYPMIQYYIGLVNFYQGGEDNLKEALKFARIQSSKNPNHFLPYQLAGDIYKLKSKGVFKDNQKKKNSYELCAKEYQKALKYLKNDLEISMSLLECYKGAGNLDLALQLTNQLQKQEGLSGYPDIYRELGSIFEQKENYEKARSYYLEYFNLRPGAKDRKDIESRIDKLIKEKNNLTKEKKE